MSKDKPRKPHGKQAISVRYSKALATKICKRLIEGDSLTRICREPGFPHKGTIYEWILLHPEFEQQYRRAREIQAEMMADEIFDIADDGSNDYRRDENGNRIVDSDHVSRSRLRVDARKWYLSKVLPKVYGEKISQEHAGSVSIRVEYGNDPSSEPSPGSDGGSSGLEEV